MIKKHEQGITGLARPASTVALSPARGISSHFRKRYYNRYRGKYRFARLMFIFDAILVGSAIMLLILDIFVYFHATFFKDSGLSLDFNAGALVAYEAVPLKVILKSTDNRKHEDVVLTWELPPYVEVLRSEPAINKNNEVRFTSILPGEEKSSIVFVRIKAEVGKTVPFVFNLKQYDLFGIFSRSTGLETREVKDSTLKTRLPIDAKKIVDQGSLPLIITNTGSITAKAVVIRLTKKEGASMASFSGNDFLAIGDILPGEEKMIHLDIGKTEAKKINLGWELQETSNIADFKEVTFEVVTFAGMSRIDLKRKSPNKISLDYENLAEPAVCMVYHPGLATSQNNAWFRIIDLPIKKTSLEFDFNEQGTERGVRWSAVLAEGQGEGRVLGQRIFGLLDATFPFVTTARYYSVAGDQLGVGPLPPKVGEATSYWIVWSLGPADLELSDVKISAKLGKGVKATGKFVAQTDGQFTSTDDAVSWTLPKVLLTYEQEVNFAFEVTVTPEASQLGKTIVLIEKASAGGVDILSSVSLQAETMSVDTNLLQDEKAKGLGKVSR